MNNSKIAIENTEEEVNPRVLQLREEETHLVRIIEAIGRVEQNLDWQILQKELFNDVANTLEHRISVEAKAKEINVQGLYNLQGQLAWAKKFSDLGELSKTLKGQLANIKKQTNG